MFKASQHIHLPYNKQGLVYFICHNYDIQPPEVRKKINSLCDKCAKEHAPALFEVMTTNTPVQAIALRHCIDSTALYRARKQFITSWFSGSESEKEVG